MSSYALLKSEYKNKLQVNKFVYNDLYDKTINYLYSILMVNCTVIVDENDNIQLTVSKNDIISIDQFTDRPLRKTNDNIDIEKFFETFIKILPNNFTTDPPNVSLEINAIEQRTTKMSILPEDLQKYLNGDTDNILFNLKLLSDQFDLNEKIYNNCTVSLFVDGWGWIGDLLKDAVEVVIGAVIAVKAYAFGKEVINVLTGAEQVIEELYKSETQYFIQAVKTGTIVIGSTGTILLFTAAVDPGLALKIVYDTVQGMIKAASSLSSLIFTSIPKIFSILYPNQPKLSLDTMKEYYKKTQLSNPGNQNMQIMDLIWVFTVIGYSVDIIIELYNIGLLIANNNLDITQKATGIIESLSIVFSMYLYPIWEQTSSTAGTIFYDFESASENSSELLDKIGTTCYVGELLSDAAQIECVVPFFQVLGGITDITSAFIDAFKNSSPPIQVKITQVDSSWVTLTRTLDSTKGIIQINKQLLNDPDNIPLGTVLESSHFITGPARYPNSHPDLATKLTSTVLSNNYINQGNLKSTIQNLQNVTQDSQNNKSLNII